jgi:hypothetical protein
MKKYYFLPCPSLRTAPSTGEAAKLTNDVTDITSYATAHIPKWMEKFLDNQRRFIIHPFVRDLLDAVSSCIDTIFRGKRNPTRLIRKTTNAKFTSDRLECMDCKKRKEEDCSTLFKQCDSCIVAVSQTKVGIGFQLLWKTDNDEEIYTSIDMVPTLMIDAIGPLEMASITNSAMIIPRPLGRLLISRADYRATSARRRTTAHPTFVRRFLCSGYVLSKKVSCVLMNMILVTIIK